MHWSVRNTMLAIVLPLTIAILAMSAAQIADLVAVRKDIEGFRDSAFRSIYAERYASSVQVLLKVSVDQFAAGGEGLEAIGSAHARTADALERLRPLVHEGASADGIVSGLTVTTLGEWERTQEQIDIYIARAADLARKGKIAQARRLLVDELKVLVRSRIFSSIDLVTQREQELFEEYRARVMRATQHRLARHVGSIDLRERLLPDFYEAILAERFARHASAEFSSFTDYVLEGRSLDSSHGIAASQSIAQLSQLRRGRAKDSGAEGEDEVAGLAESYARIHDAYARTLALPPASRSSNGRSVVRRIGETFDQSLLPRTDAIVRAHEQSIEREMARLDHWAQGILSLTIGMAVIALLLGLGSPYLASRLMVKPVVDLVDTVSSFRAGDKGARPSLRPRNELGLLASSLNGLLDELQESDRKVRALAFYDSTTGLPNRQLFQERLEGALVRARLNGYVMGLLTVNLGGLKQVNETLGIDAGDDVIRQAAKRLCECVRLSDIVSRPGGERWKTEVSRLEGDGFTILLTQVGKDSDAAFVAQRTLSKLTEAFQVEDRAIVVNTSIGIGIYPQDAGDADTLLRNASAAMN